MPSKEEVQEKTRKFLDVVSQQVKDKVKIPTSPRIPVPISVEDFGSIQLEAIK